MPAMLCSLRDLKEWLNLASPAEDGLLQRLIGAASGFIESRVGRSIGPAQYAVTFSGNGKSLLPLPVTPVIGISGVTIGRRSLPASDGNSMGYLFDDRSVRLVGWAFSPGLLNCAVRYTAGYDPIPAEIVQACVELAALRYKERDRMGETGKVVMGETVHYFVKDMPPSVATVLQRYGKVIPS